VKIKIQDVSFKWPRPRFEARSQKEKIRTHRYIAQTLRL